MFILFHILWLFVALHTQHTICISHTTIPRSSDDTLSVFLFFLDFGSILRIFW